jgi:hypothetical protein
MEINLNIILDLANPNHVLLNKWAAAASKEDILTAFMCGQAIISNKHYLAEQSIYEKLKQDHAKDIAFWKTRFHELNEQWISKYDIYQDLKAQVNILQSTNAYKGQKGESTVKQVLNKYFIGYEVKDTSGQSSMSDIHLVDKEGLTVAIECKNKEIISTTDVTKSIGDIAHIKKSAKLVGYFFISLRSNNIPKKGDILYEVIDDIPVIWYGCSSLDEIAEQDIVKMIRLLFMHYEFKPCQDEFAKSINDYMSRIKLMQKNIQNALTNLNDMKSNITNLKKLLDFMYDDLTKYLTHKETHNCNQCDAIYRRKGDLLRHIAAKHPSESKE